RADTPLCGSYLLQRLTGIDLTRCPRCESLASRPTCPRPVRGTPAAVMPRAARPRPARRDDRANDTLLRDVLVYALQDPTTTTDVVELRVLHPESPPARPRGTPDRSAVSGRTPGAPRVRLPQRLLSQ